MAESGGNSFVVKPSTATDDAKGEFQFVTVTWKIKNSSHRAREPDQEITSPQFSHADGNWELSVFPYGESRTGTIGEVVLYLKKKFSLKHELTVASQIIILSGERYYGIKIIKHTFKGNGSSFRYPNILPKDFEHLPGNTFTITCVVFAVEKENTEVPIIPITKNVQDRPSTSFPFQLPQKQLTTIKTESSSTSFSHELSQKQVKTLKTEDPSISLWNGFLQKIKKEPKTDVPCTSFPYKNSQKLVPDPEIEVLSTSFSYEKSQKLVPELKTEGPSTSFSYAFRQTHSTAPKTEIYHVSSPDPHKGHGSRPLQPQGRRGCPKGPSLQSRQRNCASKVHAQACDAPRPTQQVAHQSSHQKQPSVADHLSKWRRLEGRKSTLNSPRPTQQVSPQFSHQKQDSVADLLPVERRLEGRKSTLNSPRPTQQVSPQFSHQKQDSVADLLPIGRRLEGCKSTLNSPCSKKPVLPKAGRKVQTPRKRKARSLDPSSEFEEWYNNPQFTDVTLKSGRQEFKAHKLVLSARSKVFAAMFQPDTKESRQGIVDLLGMNVETVHDTLRYIYCGKVRDLSPKAALNLYAAADRYDLKKLKIYCQEAILANLTVNNVCEIAAEADLRDEKLLRRIIRPFLSKNAKKIVKTEKWKEMCTSNPVLCGKMFEWAFSK